VEKKKSEVKFHVGGKIEAPHRFWPLNRRGACPEIKKKFTVNTPRRLQSPEPTWCVP